MGTVGGLTYKDQTHMCSGRSNSIDSPDQCWPGVCATAEAILCSWCAFQLQGVATVTRCGCCKTMACDHCHGGTSPELSKVSSMLTHQCEGAVEASVSCGHSERRHKPWRCCMYMGSPPAAGPRVYAPGGPVVDACVGGTTART